MIKLRLPDKPIELTPEEEAKLIHEYKTRNTSVWREKFIVEPLLKMSNNKCAFSEQKLNSRSAYAEVEHFKCKHIYKDKVVEWGNLLPICKKCNVSKGKWDVCKDPIINPLIDDPKDSLFIKNFRYYEKDDKGLNTICAVNLNDRSHFTEPRSVVGFGILEYLEDNFDDLKAADSQKKRHNAINRIKSVLCECKSDKEFSAVLATCVLYEFPKYNILEAYLKTQNYWDDEFEEIKNDLLSTSLPPP